MNAEPYRALPYADPTGDLASANVDRERATRTGENPDLALHVADRYLLPIEYLTAEEDRTSYMRDEHGHRQSVAPWYDPAWTRKRRARPLRNSEVSEMLRALAPALAA